MALDRSGLLALVVALSSACTKSDPPPDGGAVEVDATTESGCDRAEQCAENARCELSVHACVCNAGFHDCSGACLSDLAVTSCGSSCSACPSDPNATASCEGGECKLTCNSGFTACGTACTTCPENNTVAECDGDRCVARDCADGYYLCGGSCCAWTIETVEEGGVGLELGVGLHLGLAVGGDGEAHLGYYDSDHDVAKYARRRASGWEIEVVDDPGSGAQFSNFHVAVDSGGQPRLVYFSSAGGLTYATRGANGWTRAPIAVAAGGGQDSAFALDDGDRPHVAFFAADNKTLRHAVLDQGAWNDAVVDLAIVSGGSPSLAVDAGDNPNLSYWRWNETGRDLVYAERAGGAWSPMRLDRTVFANDIRVDALARPHIAYHPTSTSDVRYVFRDGGTWMNELVESQNDVGAWLSLALDPEGTAHIAYTDNTTRSLKIARRGANGWSIHVVVADILPAICALAFDAAGRPHLAFRDDVARDLRYAR